MGNAGNHSQQIFFSVDAYLHTQHEDNTDKCLSGLIELSYEMIVLTEIDPMCFVPILDQQLIKVRNGFELFREQSHTVVRRCNFLEILNDSGHNSLN